MRFDDDAVETLRQLPGLHGHKGVQGVRADRLTSLTSIYGIAAFGFEHSGSIVRAN